MAADGNRRPPTGLRQSTSARFTSKIQRLVTQLLPPERFLRLHFTSVVLMRRERGPFSVCRLLRVGRPTAPRSSAASSKWGLLFLLHRFLVKNDEYHKVVTAP